MIGVQFTELPRNWQLTVGRDPSLDLSEVSTERGARRLREADANEDGRLTARR